MFRLLDVTLGLQPFHPWTTERCRTSVTSQIASSTKHRCDVVVPVSEFNTESFDDNFCCTSDTIVVESHIEDLTQDTADEMQKLTAKIQDLQETIAELSERLQQTEKPAMKSLFRYENVTGPGKRDQVGT